jgi:hexosaminidase
MTKSIAFALSFLFLTACSQKELKKEQFSIIPKPASIHQKNGTIRWKKEVTIIHDKEGRQAAEFLGEYFNAKNIKAKLATASVGDANPIYLSIIRDNSINEEGYILKIDDEDNVQIHANTAAGLFYGVQSLIQLLMANNGNEAPFVTISDSPRFAYRGLHLDVARHMFPPAFIKKYIDLMARHKFNRFHWHLTEDQGWRIEIKKYPKLQEVAAYRKETLIGHGGNPKDYDGKRYGGFYTQEEIKEIVQYAADRYVTIVPEIEMPGHSLAALSAYPTLGCTGGPYEAGTKWGVFDDVYCAGKEETFEFVQGVLDEVIELFPGEYIHIGGDESPKARWEKCPNCQKRIKTEKLKDEHQLQSYFIQRIEKYLNSKGKKIIGWDEILEGGLAPNAAVMSWRGEEGGIAAAKQNHYVVMTPGDWCYLDHYQDTTKTEPLAIGGHTPVSQVYEYEPLPPQLNEAESKYILGAQGNVWTEYMSTTDHVEYMVYPRACALAEVLWTPKKLRDYNDFLQRMQVHFNRLDAWNVNSANHIRKEIKK